MLFWLCREDCSGVGSRIVGWLEEMGMDRLRWNVIVLCMIGWAVCLELSMNTISIQYEYHTNTI